MKINDINIDINTGDETYRLECSQITKTTPSYYLYYPQHDIQRPNCSGLSLQEQTLVLHFVYQCLHFDTRLRAYYIDSVLQPAQETARDRAETDRARLYSRLYELR